MTDTKEKTQPTDSEAFPAPSDKDIQQARAEGIKEAIKESTKDAYKRGANEGYGDNDAPSQRFTGTANVAHIQDFVDLPLDELSKIVNGKADPPVAITEAQIAGLLEVERSGKNRTDVVKLLCKRLDIKSPYEVTAAGPAYTNDTTNISEL